VAGQLLVQLSGWPYVVTLLRNVVEAFSKPGFLRNYVIEKKYYLGVLDVDPACS
jgi:hypothetical protein